jgi:hypothetical protein
MRRLTVSGTKRFGGHHLRSYISSGPTHNSYMTATICRTSSFSCGSASTKLEPLLGPEMGLPVQPRLQRCRALGKSRRDVISVMEQGKDTVQLSFSICLPLWLWDLRSFRWNTLSLSALDSHLSPHSVRDNPIGDRGSSADTQKRPLTEM